MLQLLLALLISLGTLNSTDDWNNLSESQQSTYQQDFIVDNVVDF